MNRCCWTVVILLLLVAAARGDQIVLPDDPRAVIDVKRDCGAVGDGVADDTAALQLAIERTRGADFARFIYLPRGVYRVTDTLVLRPPGEGKVGSMVGPWLIGEDRATTLVKLDDGAAGFGDPAAPRAVIRGVPRPDGAKMNADFFDRTLRNLTIDAGDNRGAVGVQFYSNNTGQLYDVTVRGNGAIGVDLGSHDQNGPLLVQDAEVDGFATGIATGSIVNSQTLSRVTVRNAGVVGLLHRGQVLSVEGLHVIGAPLAIDSATNGVLTLADCVLEGPGSAGGAAAGPAVRIGEKARAYVLRLRTTGYARAVASATPAGDAAGPEVAEYASHPPVRLAGSGVEGLRLTPPREPVVPLPTRAEDWVCANDLGAAFADEEDDAPALQRAIDEAARRGASTVYLLGGKRGDPNWYHLRQDVRIHGSVSRVMGFGQVRLLGGSSKEPNYPENLAKFVIEDDPAAPPVVVLEHLQVFSPVPSFGVEVRATRRTVVCRSNHGTILARPGATVFVTNCVGHLYQERGSTVWARQWNTERGPEQVRVNTRNDGGRLWVLGMKTEAFSTKAATLRGGHSEFLGVLNYNNAGAADDTPFFLVEDAALAVAGYREVHFGGKWWQTPVRSVIGGVAVDHPGGKWQSWSLLTAGRAAPRP